MAYRAPGARAREVQYVRQGRTNSFGYVTPAVFLLDNRDLASPQKARDVSNGKPCQMGDHYIDRKAPLSESGVLRLPESVSERARLLWNSSPAVAAPGRS